MSDSGKSILKKCIARGAGRIHMSGVCGVGMAGIALLLKERGLSVSGCDKAGGAIADWLDSKGIEVAAGHSPGHISGNMDFVIRTPAVRPDDPEMMRAAKLKVPVLLRGQVLPELLEGKFSVAVCGTHGKTSTSTFIAQVLKASGRKPSWCIGGDSALLGGVAGAGKGREMVVEADESDGTLALYQPDVLVITNIEYDHMEYFGSPEAMEKCFAAAASGTKRRILYCKDDSAASRVAGKSPHKSVSYGFAADADISCRDIKTSARGQSFMLLLKGKPSGRIVLPLTGKHNVQNSLGAIGALLECGLGIADIREGFMNTALPKRRFEKIVEKAGITVVSDYAHHPTEISALVKMSVGIKAGRRLMVYQPHRYTRTLSLGRQFPPAFEGLDELVLVPVYAASEKPLPGSSMWDLYEHFRSYQSQRPSGSGKYPVVSVAGSLDKAWQYFRRNLKSGDLFLVTGAGDVEKIAFRAKDHFTGSAKTRGKMPSGVRTEYPLGRRTTFHAGGSAEYFSEISNVKALAKFMKAAQGRGQPFRVIGGCSNVIVSDTGVSGMAVRLGGRDFGCIREKGGIVSVGAGVPIAGFLSWCEERGFGGLEFLEGIPGTIGGAIRMNAGAHGGEISRYLSSISYMDTDGAVGEVTAGSAGFEYRRCRYLSDKIILSGSFSLERSDRSVISRKRQEIASKRSWWKGLRCAGSIFKNPAGAFAGKLIEDAGLKGYRIGGARIYEKHANVIVADTGARSSDIIALIEKVKTEVKAKSGIELATEVVILD